MTTLLLVQLVLVAVLMALIVGLMVLAFHE